MATRSFIAGMFFARRASALGMLVAFFGPLGITSCLYDSSRRCDSTQRFDSAAGLCVCDEAQNMIAGDHGCVPCAEHEVALNDSCSCADGYTRPSAGAACSDFPPALGTVCTEDKDCPDATYGSCRALDGGTGYCTNLCSDGTGCAGGYACDVAATTPYCKRPPIGAGQACTSDAECAGTEATFCEYFQTQVCYVECKLGGNDCFPGKECCDLTASSVGLYKTQICVDAGSCKK